MGAVRDGQAAHEEGSGLAADQAPHHRDRPQRPYGRRQLAGARARRDHGLHPRPPGRQDQARAARGAHRDPPRRRDRARDREDPAAHHRAERGCPGSRPQGDGRAGDHLLPRRVGRQDGAGGPRRTRRPGTAHCQAVRGDHGLSRARGRAGEPAGPPRAAAGDLRPRRRDDPHREDVLRRGHRAPLADGGAARALPRQQGHQAGPPVGARQEPRPDLLPAAGRKPRDRRARRGRLAGPCPRHRGPRGALGAGRLRERAQAWRQHATTATRSRTSS